MNIYKVLNEITLYIDNHLEEKIDYTTLAKMMCTNIYTMKRIFSTITGIPLGEYIRKRRLSNAASTILKKNYKVIDLALKYQYDNATSFSRAFEKFHHIKPSKVTTNTKIKEFPRIIFEEKWPQKTDIEYSVVNLEDMTLYGVGTKVTNKTITKKAPTLCATINKKYQDKYGTIKYGMISYKDKERTICTNYHVLYDKEIKKTTNTDIIEKIKIPKSKWLKFTIPSKNAKDIQQMSQKFYTEFLPSCTYNLKDIPELEYYHDSITEFLVPIY